MSKLEKENTIRVKGFYKHKKIERFAIEVKKIEDFIDFFKVWIDGYDYEGVCEPRNWIACKKQTDKDLIEISELEYVKLIDRFKLKKCIIK